MTILLGVERTPVALPPGAETEPDRWTGLSPTWTGWDGTTWDLTGATSGVLLLRGGTRGLYMPEHTRYRDESPALAGSRWRGSRTLERSVFWPLLVYSRSDSQSWVELDRAFWRTLDPERPGTWTVTHPDGQQRSLRCRYDGGGDDPQDELPVRAGWAAYGVQLVAEQPYWQGPRIDRSFRTSAASDFFRGSSKGPAFQISSGSNLANASISNPGDVQAHPVWQLHGPFTAASVGLAGYTIEVPFELTAGQSVTIDTDPAVYSAVREDGTDVTALLGASDFAPVPAGERVPLSITVSGTGWVQVSLVPLYRRAW